MSPRTGDTDPAQSKKYPLRLQMPVDDPDVDAFLAAQGVRFQSQAIVMLIRMYVNEFGPTNVLEQTMGAVTATALKRNQISNGAPARAATTEPVVVEHPAVQQTVASPAPDTKPESPQVPESTPEPEPTPASAPSPSSAAPAAPSNDFEDLFRS